MNPSGIRIRGTFACIGLVASIALVGAGIRPVQAQEAFPSKPIHIIVPFPAGGALDFIARTLGEQIAKRTGQQVLTDNRPGGNSIIAAEALMKSAPDGYTVFLTNMDTHVNNVGVFKTLPYDPIRDFQPLGIVASGGAMLVVNSGLPVKTLDEFVAYARTHPNEVSFGTWGPGSYSDLAGHSFARVNRLEMNIVPYKGETPIMQDLLGKNLASAMASVLIAKPHIEKGSLRAFAINGSARAALMPDLPTFTELGYTDPILTMQPWFGLYAPAKTPRPLADKWNQLYRDALADPGVRQSLIDRGFDPTGSSIAEHEERLRAQIKTFTQLMREIGIQPQ